MINFEFTTKGIEESSFKAIQEGIINGEGFSFTLEEKTDVSSYTYAVNTHYEVVKVQLKEC